MSDRQVKCTRALEVELSEQDLISISDEAMVLQEELSGLEKEKKTVVRDFNDKIKILKTDIAEKCHNYTMGTQYAEVICTTHYDLKSGTTWAEYNGQRYAETDMTEQEIADTKQGELDLVDPAILGAGDAAGGEMLAQ